MRTGLVKLTTQVLLELVATWSRGRRSLYSWPISRALRGPSLPASGRQTLVSRGRQLQSTLLCLSETQTHQAHRQAGRFAAAAASGGWPGYAYSPGTGRALGTAVLGPQHLRPDPYVWSDLLNGRITSAVLPCGTSDLLVIGVYMPVGGGEARLLRAEAAREIATRVACSDLPCILAGDWNCPPHAEELAPLTMLCDYAHELVDVQYHSSKDHCIDFALVGHLKVSQVFVDMKISDHRSVFVEVDILAI